MTGFFRNFLLILMLAVCMGCSSRYHMNRNDLGSMPAWPYYRGDRAASGVVENGTFNGQLNILWENKTNGKVVGPLTIYHQTLVLPDSKKKIKYYDVISGHYLGKTACKGIPQTGLVLKDSLAYFSSAPRNNTLRCLNLLNNKWLWKQPVKDAAAGSILLDNSLIISSGEGSVIAFDVRNGKVLWKAKTEGKLVAPASYSDGKLYQPGSDGYLYVFSVADGHELYRVETTGPLVNAVVADKLVYVTDVLGSVSAYEPVAGSKRWQVQLSGPIWTSPVLSGEKLFVGHSGGSLVALQASSGHELWRYETGEVIKASPIVVGNYLITGTMAGKVFVLKTSDGTLVDRKNVNGAVAFSPVSDGQRLFIATRKGKIICFGEDNEKLTQTGQ